MYRLSELGNKIFQRDTNQNTVKFTPHWPTKRRSRRTGRGSTCPHMWQYYLEGLLYAEIQEPDAGERDPVAHGASTFRRNSPGRGDRYRSVRQVQASPPPSPSFPPRQQFVWRFLLARRQCLDRPFVGNRTQLLGPGILLRQ